MSLSFYVFSSHREFFNRKNSCVREELIDLPFLPFSSEQKLWKSSYGIIKKPRKKNDPKSRNGKILRTFGPYISDQNYSKVCKFLTFTTSHSFFDYILLIFQICTVQWLNCTNLKYEQNPFYIGGGVVYVLKVRHFDQHDSRHSRDIYKN